MADSPDLKNFYSETNTLCNQINVEVTALTKWLSGRANYSKIEELAMYGQLFQKMAEARHIAHELQKRKP